MALKKNVLTKELEEFCRQQGADLFGVADLALARDFVVSQGGPLVGQFPRAISLGMRLCDAIVKNHSPDEAHGESLYWWHLHIAVNPKLDFLAYDVARWLLGKNFEALPVPATLRHSLEKREDVEKSHDIFSHKLAAHLAGLGWIGKNCLLITEEFGPRVRFVSVLTDAPLETGSVYDRQCGRCHVCVSACPVGAFRGVEFRATESREVRYDASKCIEYRRTHYCGRCVSLCPNGMRKRGRLNNEIIRGRQSDKCS